MMSWKAGDLGRFKTESDKRPRFEVLGKHPSKGVAVWYGGDEKPTFIPLDTFTEKSVKHWVIQLIPALPSWIRPGVAFKIHDKASAHLTQAEIRIRYNLETTKVNVYEHALTLRRIQYDYASCFDVQQRCLVMVPIKTIIAHGSQIVTALDRLLQEDPFEDDLLV